MVNDYLMVIWLGGWAYPSEQCDFVSWVSMTFPTEWKDIKFMFQTTKQFFVGWMVVNPRSCLVKASVVFWK